MKNIKVKLYSVEHDAFWRLDRVGYTCEWQAGVWRLAELTIRPDAIVPSLDCLKLNKLPSDAHIAVIQT